MKPITTRQQETLDFIKKFIARESYPPSVREIMAGLNLVSPSTVHSLLEQLEDKGFITRVPDQTRSLRVVEQEPSKEQLRIAQLEYALKDIVYQCGQSTHDHAIIGILTTANKALANGNIP